MTITSLSFCIQSLWKSCTREFHIKNNTNCWKWLIWSSLNKFLPLFLFLFFLQVSRKITRFFLKTTLHPCKKRKRKEKEEKKKKIIQYINKENIIPEHKKVHYLFIYFYFFQNCVVSWIKQDLWPYPFPHQRTLKIDPLEIGLDVGSFPWGRHLS